MLHLNGIPGDGVSAFTAALWCRRRANCAASCAKAGASLTVTELDRSSQRQRRRTASQQGAQEKQRNNHLTALSLQLIPGYYFWKNNPGTHFIFSTEILRGSSRRRSILWTILQHISILWNSPFLIEIPVSFGGNWRDIHKAAEIVNKQCLLLTKLWGILPWSSMRISWTTIAARKEGN